MALFETKSDPAAQAADQLRSSAYNQFRQIQQAGRMNWSLLWKNRSASPEQILAALGTDAGAVLALAALNAQTLKSAANIGGASPPVVPEIPAGYSLTKNADGSVSLKTTVGSHVATPKSISKPTSNVMAPPARIPGQMTRGAVVSPKPAFVSAKPVIPAPARPLARPASSADKTSAKIPNPMARAAVGARKAALVSAKLSPKPGIPVLARPLSKPTRNVLTPPARIPNPMGRAASLSRPAPVSSKVLVTAPLRPAPNSTPRLENAPPKPAANPQSRAGVPATVRDKAGNAGSDLQTSR